MTDSPLSEKCAENRQLWLRSEGESIFYSCGPKASLDALGVRHLAARVCDEYETGPCCMDEDMPCAFDLWAEHGDRQIILSWALRRAEGRSLEHPPYRCPACNRLSYGGCHPEFSPYDGVL